MKHQPLHLSRLSLALSLITCSTLLPAQAFAAAEAHVALAHMIENANSSPASMCFVLKQNQHVIDEFNNLHSFLALTSSSAKASVAPARAATTEDTASSTPTKAQAAADTNEDALAAQAGIIPHHAYIDNGNLCLSHLKHGEQYNLTLKKGLKLTNGSVLRNDVDFPFAVTDAPAQIRLPYNIILPKNARNTSFTIQSINQDKFTLSLYRIPSSALNSLNLPSLFANTIDNYDLINLLQNVAHPLVQKTITLEKKANETQSTDVSLKEMIADADDGLYLIIASDPRIDSNDYNSLYSYQRADLPFSAKVMMLTDLGMSTYRSDDEILVNMRSLTTAKTLAGVKLDLLSKSNEVLASTVTDENGVARFGHDVISGKYALAPQSIIARSDNDVYCFDVSSKPLYLEDNDGVEPVGQYETFAWTDRGVYREGEDVHFTALVRNTKLEAADLPLTLQILNPLGVEIDKVLLKEAKSGGYDYSFTLPAGTKHGRCLAVVKLGDKEISRTAFTVGSFIPFQIQSTILNDDPLLKADTSFTFKSKTSFNYGGAANNLSGSLRVRAEPDLKPVFCSSSSCLSMLNDFHFGPDARTVSKMTTIDNYYDLRTDVEGVLQKKLKIASASYPQKITISSSVFDTSNQEVTASRSYKLTYDQPLIGVRQVNSKTHDVGFALCSCLQDGSTSPQDVHYYLYKEFNDFNFVYVNERWQYVNFKSRDLVAQGSLKVDNLDLNAPLINADLSDGSYVLELKGDTSNTTLAFTKGYLSAENANSPDRISLYTDKEQYSVGDEAVLSFDSPFDGYANVALGSRGISKFSTLEIKKGHNEVKVKITDDLYPQGHALLSIFSPLPESNIGAVRAVGISRLKLNVSDHLLDVDTTVAQESKPQQPLEVQIKVKPQQETQILEQPYARVTVVDNGILDITNYKAPDPKKTLLQDQKYTVDLYDAYGYLMTDPQQLGQGYGDMAEGVLLSSKANGKSPSQPSPKTTVALASKIIPINADGTAHVSFTIPQFSGSVKVMTVAWDKNKTGSTSEDVMIRDNAVASLGLPRFLHNGDTTEARIFLHNLSSEYPDFKYDITCSGALKCSSQSISQLKQGMRSSNSFTLRTVDTGEGTIHLKVMNQDFTFNESYTLNVSEPQLPLVRNYITALAPGETKKLKLQEDFSNIETLFVSTSSLPGVNPEALVRQLDTRFDTDIIADLESKLLYGSLLLQKKTEGADDAKKDDLEKGTLYTSEASLNHEIDTLIKRVLASQNQEGAFHYSDYITAYATSVLLEAKNQNFSVNETALENALRYLRKHASQLEYGDGAYINDVLSSLETINQAQIRQMADKNKMQSPLNLAHLANALQKTGDTERAKNMLEKAITSLLQWQTLEKKLATTEDNGKRYELLSQISQFNTCSETNLRHDSFVVLESCLRAHQQDLAEKLIHSLDVLKETPEYLSALTISAMLRAAHVVDAQDKGNSHEVPLESLGKDQTLTLHNDSDKPVFTTTSVLGAIEHSKSITDNGILVNVNYFNKEGRVDPEQYNFRVNEEVLMEVNFTRQLAADADGFLRVKLPAGFEYVRRAVPLDPSFGKLLKDVYLEDVQDLEVNDSELSALWPDYNQGSSHSLFIVIRAALPGTYHQGEALLQLKKNPQYYGSCLNKQKLRISDK